MHIISESLLMSRTQNYQN